MAAQPSLNIRAATLFPGDWQALPTHGKVLTALAAQAGLTIICHRGQWGWAGTCDQLKASGLFPRSQLWDEVGEEISTGDGIRATIVPPVEAGTVTLFVWFVPMRPASRGALAAMASTDAAFRTFLAATLQPVDVSAEEPTKFDEGWEGPIEVTISPRVFGLFKQRGVFRQFWMAGGYFVSESMARALHHYCASQTGQAMAALRKRLEAALQAHTASAGRA